MMDDIAERLQEIIDQERSGIDRLREEAATTPTPTSRCATWREQMAQRKQEAMDSLPDDTAGRLQHLMDYEFLDQQARDDFQELVNELRQKMLGDQFRMMQQSLERLTQEDLGPMREMMRALNQLLAKHVRGGATEQDFREFMDRVRSLLPGRHQEHRGPGRLPGAAGGADGVAAGEHAGRHAPRSSWRRCRRCCRTTDLQDDIMQMADLVEQITGRPLGRRYPFSGDEPVDFDKAFEIMQRPQPGR